MFVGAGITFLMSISDGTLPYFLSKDGKKGKREGGNGRTESYFPPMSAFCNFDEILFSLFVLDFGV